MENKGKRELQCFVKDSGIGLSSSEQKMIFDRFIQVDASETRNYGGTGLGLSITKAFVNLLGGDIWVKSKKHHGATFISLTLLHGKSHHSSATYNKQMNEVKFLRTKQFWLLMITKPTYC